MKIESHLVLYNLFYDSLLELKLLVMPFFKANRFIFSLNSSFDVAAPNLRASP